VGTRQALTSASGRSGIRGLIELLIANDWVCLKQPTGVVLIFPKPPHTLLERVCCGTSSLCSARHRWNVPKLITLYHLVKSGMLLHSFHLERWNVPWNKQAKSFHFLNILKSLKQILMQVVHSSIVPLLFVHMVSARTYSYVIS
jgi:hypothetical protein